MSIPTPVTGKLPESVYDPAEDSFLLIDAIEEDKEFLKKLNPRIVLEIGVGSGVISSFVKKLLDSIVPKHNYLAIGTDINPEALLSTRKTFSNEGQKFPELINCSLLSPLESRLSKSIDVIIFNPPYVPTDDLPEQLYEYCFAGGPTGRSALDKLLPKISNLLSQDGCFYLVALKSNDIQEIFRMSKSHNLDGKILIDRKCGCEHLYILQFYHIRNKLINE